MDSAGFDRFHRQEDGISAVLKSEVFMNRFPVLIGYIDRSFYLFEPVKFFSFVIERKMKAIKNVKKIVYAPIRLDQTSASNQRDTMAPMPASHKNR
jgi:ABC-type microcin C transport system permease subunit YejE